MLISPVRGHTNVLMFHLTNTTQVTWHEEHQHCRIEHLNPSFVTSAVHSGFRDFCKVHVQIQLLGEEILNEISQVWDHKFIG